MKSLILGISGGFPHGFSGEIAVITPLSSELTPGMASLPSDKINGGEEACLSSTASLPGEQSSLAGACTLSGDTRLLRRRSRGPLPALSSSSFSGVQQLRPILGLPLTAPTPSASRCYSDSVASSSD